MSCYNINADHMAAACAEYLGADRLIYLTTSPAFLDGDKVLSAVSWEEIERLVQSRVVSGGMVLKLEAAKRAPRRRRPRSAHRRCGSARFSPGAYRKPPTSPRSCERHAGTRVLGSLFRRSQAALSRRMANLNKKKAARPAMQKSKRAPSRKPKLDTRLSDRRQFLLPLTSASPLSSPTAAALRVMTPGKKISRLPGALRQRFRPCPPTHSKNHPAAKPPAPSTFCNLYHNAYQGHASAQAPESPA